MENRAGLLCWNSRERVPHVSRLLRDVGIFSTVSNAMEYPRVATCS
jgi:hypothetical protein